MAEEIYTPSEVPQSSGLGRSLVGNAAYIGLDRAAAVHRTMRTGTMSSNGLIATMFGLNQTSEEMSAFAGTGKSPFMPVNWRTHVWGNPAINKAMGLEGRASILGTKWAPSSWASAIDVANGQGNLGMYNVARGAGLTDDVVEGVTGGYWRRQWTKPKGWKVGMKGRRKIDRFVQTGDIETLPWTSKLEAGSDYYNRTLNKFVGIGTAKGTNVVRDYTLGKMFNMSGPYAASEEFLSKGLFRGFYAGSETLQKGAAIAEYGGRAIGGATKLGLAARGAFSAVGLGLRAYTWYSTVELGAKAAYKGWELYNIKAPLAAYKMVGSQLTRGAFSSGDASFLTGIPANNRMRAVQAIQGSRMNARSALGGEASLLAGHFG